MSTYYDRMLRQPALEKELDACIPEEQLRICHHIWVGRLHRGSVAEPQEVRRTHERRLA